MIRIISPFFKQCKIFMIHGMTVMVSWITREHSYQCKLINQTAGERDQSKYTQVCSYECKHPSWLTSHAPTGREELYYNAIKPCDVSQLGCLHAYEHTCVYLP